MTAIMLNRADLFEDFSDTDNEDENSEEGGNNEGYKSDDSIHQDVLDDLQRATTAAGNTSSSSVLNDSHASAHPLFDLPAAFTASLSSSDRIHDNFIAKNSTRQQYRTIKQKSQHHSSHREKKRLLEEIHQTIKPKSQHHYTKKNNDTTIVTATTADDNSSYGDNNTELSLQFLRSQVSTPETIRNEAVVREVQRSATIEDTAEGSSSSRSGSGGGGEDAGVRGGPHCLGTPVDFNAGTAQPPNGRIDTMDDPMDYLQIGTTTPPHPKTKKENGNITNTGRKRADAAAVGNNNNEDSIPFEITIIDEYPTTTTTTSNHAEGPTLCVLEQIKEVEHQVQFLRSKLDQSNDIIESNFRDMEKARYFIHNLVQRNVQLQTQLSCRTQQQQPPSQYQPPHSENPGGAAATNALDHYERGEIGIESYWLLKGALYVSLGLYLLGSHELFLAMMIFVWLVLEQ